MKGKIKWKMRKELVIIILILCLRNNCLESTSLDRKSVNSVKNEQEITKLFSINATTDPHSNFKSVPPRPRKFTEYYKKKIYVQYKNQYNKRTEKSKGRFLPWDPNFNINSFTKKICHHWKEYRFDVEKYNSMSNRTNISNSPLDRELFATNEVKPSASSDLPEGCYFKDHNIQTSEVICSGTDIKKVPWFKLRHVDKLTFDNTSIQIVDKSVVDGLPVVAELTFTRGVLMIVDFEDLLKSQPILEKLSITHNCISSVSFTSFYISNQPQILKFLNFQNNMIIFLPEPVIGDEPTLQNLKSLNFNHNPMCVLPGDMFFPLRDAHLTELYLKQSGIEEIGTPSRKNDSSPLVYLPHLEHLDLSYNPYLTTFQLDKLLLPLKNRTLISLCLSSNYYIEIPTAALSHVQSSLQILDLEGLSVRCLDGSSFPSMPYLTTLNLQHSRISQIRVEAFNFMPSLEVLLLDGNDLLTIPTGMALRQLKILSLRNNPSITNTREASFRIINNTFSGFVNLEELYLSNVPLRRIDNFIFKELSSLATLELSQSSLSDIEAYSFRDLRMLKYLDLSYNEISMITSDTFDGLENLIFIDLSHNKISFGMTVTPITSLTQYASSNSTTFAKMAAEQNYVFNKISSLEVLNISSNLMHELVPEMFDQFYYLRILELGNNQVKSWTEPLFKRNNHITLIVLNDNDIHRLTKAMISDLSKYNLTVDLRKNSLLCTCQLTAFYEELNETTFEGLDGYHCFNGTTEVLVEDYVYSLENTNCSDRLKLYIPVPLVDADPIRKNKSIVYGSIIAIIFLCVAVVAVLSYRNRWYARYLIYKVKVKIQYMNFKPDSENYDYDTFICYAQADRQWVFEKLVDQLESIGSGLKVCLHERDFLVGEAITHNIIRSVEKSRKVIVVISMSFVQSAWCMFELQMASNKILDEKKNKLILLLLEPIDFDEQPKELRLLLKSRTYISWNPEEESQRLFWARLMRVIAKPTSLNDQTVSESSDQVLQDTISATNETAQISSNICEDGTNQRDDNLYDVKIMTNECSTGSSYVNKSYESCEALSVKNLINTFKIENTDSSVLV